MHRRFPPLLFPSNLNAGAYAAIEFGKNKTWLTDKQQMIKSTAYASFSVFGPSFTAGLGFLIIIISYTIESILGYWHRRRQFKSSSYLEWISNSTMQLQRLAHQAFGAGTWSRATKDVSVTKAGEYLALLDLTDPKQPLLRCPSNGDTNSTMKGFTPCQTGPAAAEINMTTDIEANADTEDGINTEDNVSIGRMVSNLGSATLPENGTALQQRSETIHTGQTSPIQVHTTELVQMQAAPRESSASSLSKLARSDSSN